MRNVAIKLNFKLWFSSDIKWGMNLNPLFSISAHRAEVGLTGCKEETMTQSLRQGAKIFSYININVNCIVVIIKYYSLMS